MHTEKATNFLDLPHEYKPDRAMPDSECRCGREKADALHHAVVVEHASHVETFTTEKGI